MAELTYNIDTLYRQAFPDLASKALAKLDGVRDLALDKLDTTLGNGFKVPPKGQSSTEQLNFKGINAVKLIQGEEMSYLGTPIFQPITFLGGRYNMLGIGEQQGQVIKTSYNGWQLPPTATAEFKRAKTVTTTSPNGAFSSSKELYAFQDWSITIRGLILDEQPNFFPAGQLRQLLSWEKVADSIEVSGEMFGFLGIPCLIMQSIDIGKIVGMPNVIPFQLQCIGDESKESAAAQEAEIRGEQYPNSLAKTPPGYVRFVVPR